MLECILEMEVVSCGVGDWTNFGSLNFFVDVFLEVPDDFTVLFCVIVWLPFEFGFLSSSYPAYAICEDLAKLLTALGIIADVGDTNFCAFVGVVGGGCGTSCISWVE